MPRTCPIDRKKYYAVRGAQIQELIDSGSTVHIARRILKDCRTNDRKKGMECDLDFQFVHERIQQPCFYCGEADYRRSLDRIDNNKGHCKTNVVTACVRCNLTRTTMPYEAWLIVAKGMREARERGLFGDWFGIKKCGRMVGVEGLEPVMPLRAPDLESSASAFSPHPLIVWSGGGGGS
jgi:hypothetical protein